MSIPTATSADLARMRDAATSLLTDTATVRRPSTTQDATGAPATPTYTTIYQGAARLTFDRKGANEAVEGGRLASRAHWFIRVPAGTDVRPQDQILVGTRLFEVVVAQSRATAEVLRRVRCMEIL